MPKSDALAGRAPLSPKYTLGFSVGTWRARRHRATSIAPARVQTRSSAPERVRSPLAGPVRALGTCESDDSRSRGVEAGRHAAAPRGQSLRLIAGIASARRAVARNAPPGLGPGRFMGGARPARWRSRSRSSRRPWSSSTWVIRPSAVERVARVMVAGRLAHPSLPRQDGASRARHGGSLAGGYREGPCATGAGVAVWTPAGARGAPGPSPPHHLG